MLTLHLLVFVDCSTHLAWRAESCFLYNICTFGPVLGWDLLSGKFDLWCICFYMVGLPPVIFFFQVVCFADWFWWADYCLGVKCFFRHVLYQLMGWNQVSILLILWFTLFRWKFYCLQSLYIWMWSTIEWCLTLVAIHYMVAGRKILCDI